MAHRRSLSLRLPALLLAAALLELHAQRSVRIAGLGRYRSEA